MDTKKCPRCKVDKSVEQFNWKNKGIKLQAHCKICQAECSSKWYYKNSGRLKEKASKRNQAMRLSASKYLIDYKESLPCVDCGGRFPHYVMDFDHIAKDKIACVSRMKSRSLKIIINEIDKCELICSNCHRARTWNRVH
jgi:hypothetical protein